MKPLYEYVIARPISVVHEKKGSLYVPETARNEKVDKATILAVGEGRPNEHGTMIPLLVKPGDVILYWKHEAQTIEYNGEDALILREIGILAYLRKGEK